MPNRTSARRSAIVGLVALVVLIGFLARRTGLVPGRDEPFDPADYQNAPALTAAEAGDWMDQRAIVCGPVVNAVFARETRGQPTFLNLERPHPDQPFDIVIWGRNREAFEGPPEQLYGERELCAAGRIGEHEGVPRIEVAGPEQIFFPGGAAGS